MSYTKKTWKNYPDTTTPITADNLNHMENGIADAHTDIAALNTSLNHYRFRTVDGVKQVSDDDGATWENFLKGAELLWENSAPADAFNEQLIPISNIADYDFIIIETLSYTFEAASQFPKIPCYFILQKGIHTSDKKLAGAYAINPYGGETIGSAYLVDNGIQYVGSSSRYQVPQYVYGCKAMSVPAKYKGVVEDLGTTSLPHTINCKKDTVYIVTVTVTSGYEPLPCPISNCEVLANTPRRGYTISYVVKATSNTMVVGTSIGNSISGLFVAEC